MSEKKEGEYTATKKEEELAPVNPSGVELGEEITLAQIRPYFKSFYLNRPYIYLVGGICNHGKTKGDIDIFIRKVFRDVPLEFRITRMFPRELQDRIHFIYPEPDRDDHLGVYTNHIPIFDEKIEVLSAPELVLMSIPKKVELFKFAKLLKPAHGHFKGEEYSIDKLIEVVNAKPEWYEHGIYVQKKFDGVHVRADHSKAGKVIIWTEEGNNITEKLPTLVTAIKKACGNRDVIFVGELEFWDDKKHQSRQKTTAIIHTKKAHPDEGKVILNFFDVLFYDQDIHNEPYSERLKFVDELRECEQLRKAKYTLVRTPTELKREVEHYASQPGSEGAYLKRADFPYELDGKTLLNLKYKNTFSIDAKVVEVHEVKDTNAFNYLCVIEDKEGKGEIPIGRSYNTSIKVGEGAILKVEFVTLSQYTDQDRVWFNWWSPNVIMAREDKQKPDNELTAKKLVLASKGTIAEKPWPKRYEDSVDPYLAYRDESKKWKGMCHSHIRGRSVHLDFRLQISKDYMIGWTLYIPKGLSKDPETFAEAKALNEKEIMPVVIEKLSKPLLKFNCRKKMPEPIEWATYKGTVQPGSIGATKKEHGHFIIIDSFEVEYGAQKPHFHEYFLHGGKFFDGRFVFTLLENKEEWEKTDEGLMTWMASLVDESPYVLSNRAKNKKWIPPYTFSALPAKLRNKVPKNLRYWEHKNLSERMGLRDELVRQIKKRLMKIDALGPAQFRFIRQTWEGEKTVHSVYYLIVFQRSPELSHFCLIIESDMTKTKTTSGLEAPKLIQELKKIEAGEVSAGNILNPTTTASSWIEIVDEGPANIVSASGLRRFQFKGKKMKGTWVAFRQYEGSKMWKLNKSELLRS